MTKADAKQVEYPLGPALDFLQCLWRLNHALERRSARMERSLGITAQQRLIVRCVGKYPGMTAGQVAGVLHIDPGTVSATLNRLENKQLLERRRDSRDKRRITLGLTAKGRTLSQPSLHTVEHAVEQLLGSADAAAVAATKELLGALTEQLGRDAQ